MSSTFRGLSEAEVYLYTAISVREAVVKTGCARKTCKSFMYFFQCAIVVTRENK
jgi:hypothetical protein